MSRAVQHDLREAGVAHGAQLGLERPRERDRVHAEVVEFTALAGMAHRYQLEA